MKAKTNMTMLCDFYELTMGNGYFQTGLTDRICYFDVFYRSVPDQGGFAIAAGLAQVVEYIENLHFDEEDIAYLRSKDCFAEEFLDYLRNFSFTGDIWAVPEGTPIFPGEPILTVRAPAIQAQFIETFVLLCLNHQCLIATKSNRIVRAAEGRPVAEFGSRRAHGPDGALLGARASYIAGCSATACTMADQHYGPQKHFNERDVTYPHADDGDPPAAELGQILFDGGHNAPSFHSVPVNSYLVSILP